MPTTTSVSTRRRAIVQYPSLPKAMLPLWELVPAERQHYFNHQPARFFRRSFELGSSPHLLPLARAFLDTCAADQSSEFQYVFTLLGNELATNALEHSRSGSPGGHFILTCHRLDSGLYLACADEGNWNTDHALAHVDHLAHFPEGLSLESETGRGLAMINLLATSWGDNGFPSARQVWFYLSFDLAGSSWNTL